MAKVTEHSQLMHWLDDNNREVAIAIASRAALRVLPAVIELVEEQAQERSSSYVLPLFRGLATSWFSATWPNQDGEIEYASAATAAFASATAATFDVVDRAALDSLTTKRPFEATNIASSVAAAVSSASAIASSADIFTSAEAADAADAVSSAAVDVDDAVWDEIVADVGAIDAGMPPDVLMRRRLWESHEPESIARQIAFLNICLFELGDNWQVWTQWYDDRLRGADYSDSYPLIEALELARILIPDDEWGKGPKHVNAIIAELEIEYRAQTPPQRPAIIEVEYGDDGRLHRRPARRAELRDDAQEQRVRAAWAAHSQQLAALEALDPGKNSPAFASALRAYRAALGSDFDELKVIELGVHGARLVAYAENANEYFLEDVASEVAGLAAAHGLFVRQFPDWRDYLDDSVADVPDEVNDAAVGFARSLSDEPEIIAEDIATAAADLADMVEQPLAADPDDRPSQMLRGELLRSESNILSGLLAPLLDRARDLDAAAWKGMLKGVEGSFEKMVKATLLGGSTYAMALATGMPAEFGWLIPVLTFLKMKLGSQPDKTNDADS